MKTIEYVLLILLVLIIPASEAIEKNGQKELTKILRALWVGIALLLMQYELTWNIFFIVVLVRLLFHGYTWNIFRKEVTLYYLGKGFWDRYIEKYIRLVPVWVTLFVTLIIMTLIFFGI